MVRFTLALDFLLALTAMDLEATSSSHTSDLPNTSDLNGIRNPRIDGEMNYAVKDSLNPKEVLDYLNDIRRQEKSKDMKELNWNFNLAKRSQKLVEGCKFTPVDRPTRAQYGLAIHSSYGTRKVKGYREVFDAWYEERKQFDFSTFKCTGFCTNYVMLARSDFDWVGCAASDCGHLKNGSSTQKDAFFMACEFFSTFNDSLPRPNSKGTPCSGCHSTFKLCRSDLCAKVIDEQILISKRNPVRGLRGIKKSGSWSTPSAEELKDFPILFETTVFREIPPKPADEKLTLLLEDDKGGRPTPAVPEVVSEMEPPDPPKKHTAPSEAISKGVPLDLLESSNNLLTFVISLMMMMMLGLF